MTRPLFYPCNVGSMYRNGLVEGWNVDWSLLTGHFLLIDLLTKPQHTSKFYRIISTNNMENPAQNNARSRAYSKARKKESLNNSLLFELNNSLLFDNPNEAFFSSSIRDSQLESQVTRNFIFSSSITNKLQSSARISPVESIHPDDTSDASVQSVLLHEVEV